MGNRNLPPPIRPNARSSSEENEYSRPSLSDFSDYESSDEGTFEAAGQSSSSKARKPYVNVDYDSDEIEIEDARRHVIEDEDPFADPFAD